MAAPTVRAYSTPNNGTDAAPAFTVNQPAGVASGDLLLAFAANDTNSTAWTVSPGNGWVKLSDESTSAIRLAVYALIADGSDALSIAAANNNDYSVVMVAIQTGTHGVTNVSTDIVIPALSSGTSGNANPPSADGGTSKDWLSFAAACVDMTATGDSISAYPSNYGNGVLTKSASSTSSVGLGVGHRALTAAQTEDPGTFTNTSRAWIAKTVLVPPVDTFKDGVANGSISWVGSSTGVRTPKGSASGSISWVGSATGGHPPNDGSVSGAISWVGSVNGESPSGGGTAFIGYTDTGGATSSSTTGSTWTNEAQVDSALRYTAGSGDVVTKVSVWGNRGLAGTGGAEVGVYVYSGGVPTTKVGSANITIPGGSGTDAEHSTTVSWALTEGVVYVVAIDYQTDFTNDWNMHYQSGAGGTNMSTTNNQDALPSTWSQTGTSDARVPFWATVTQGGGGAPSEGSASGSISWAGSANGSAPLLIQDGSAEGTISWSGSSVGTRLSLGSASGAISWVGSANGEAPSSGAEMTQTRRLSQRVINNGAVGGNGDYTSNSFTTVAGSLLVAIISYDCQNDSGPPNFPAAIPTPTTSGLTWVKHASIYADFQYTCMADIWIADNPSSGSKTIAQDGGAGAWSTSTNCIDVNIYEYTDALAEADQEGATAGRHDHSIFERDPGAEALTLSAAPLDTSYVLAVCNVDGGQTVSTTAPGTGWTEDVDVPTGGSGGPYMGTQIQYRTDSTSTSVDWNDVTTCWDYSLLALEIQAAEATAPPNEGSVSGSITWVGSADGESPVVGVNDGSASGAISWGGSVTGTSSYRGSAAGSIIWSGSASGGIFAWPASISGRKVLDQDGNVFLMMTASSWRMAHRLTTAEATDQLEATVAAGFNGVTVWCGSAEDRGGVGQEVYLDIDGNNFWSGTPWASSLGPAWAKVDHIIEECLRLGLVFHFSFCSGWGNTGAGPDWEAVTNTNMYNVGVEIATRYASYPNIVWHIMFDDSVAESSTRGQRIQSLFDGINDTEGANTRPVRWCEVANGSTTVEGGWYGVGHFNCTINSIYEYVDNPVEALEAEYGETSGPVGDCEPPYDGSPNSGASHEGLRYRVGGLLIENLQLINWGHEDLWPMGAEGLFSEGIGLDNLSVMTHASALEAGYIFNFVRLHAADVDWAPTSSLVVTGEGSGANKAAQGFRPRSALAYFRNSRTIQIDTTILEGDWPVRIRWWDPTDGGFHSQVASNAPQQTNHSITHPGNTANSAGAGDFILVIEANVPPNGSASGSIAWVGSATGTKPSSGSASGSISWAGSATGTRIPKGSVSGSIAWSGTAVGGNLGVAVGSITWVGSSTGARASSGAVSGSIAWVGSADGIAPAVGVNDGSASGAISWAGSATGKKTPVGSVSGSISWSGTAIGGNLGVAVGSITWAGSAEGSAPVIEAKQGSVTGAISWVGAATGFSGLVFIIVGFITGEIAGPDVSKKLVTGPSLRRTITGPELSRDISGPDLNDTEELTGPDRTVSAINGPSTSRTVTGPGTTRTVTGPES